MPVVIILSGGGVKSAVAAARYAKDHELVFLHVNHGQPAAARECAAIDRLAQHWKNARVVRATLPHMSQLHSAGGADARESDTRVSRGIVGSVSGIGTGTPVGAKGLLPVLCSLGLQAALGYRAVSVVLGLTRSDDAAHLGLSGIETHPDLRREFLHAFNIMSETLLRPRTAIKLEAPLVEIQYHEVMMLARRFQIPLEHTWTCAHAGSSPCLQCSFCRARSAACTQAGMADPLVTRPFAAANA